MSPGMTPSHAPRYRERVPKLTRYRSPDEDNARWVGFPFREGDIVISTRSKSGTTWMQMVCALLIFQTPELPDSLGRLSPWLDWVVTPREEVVQRLQAQRHRRFIKTHTPLDGVPFDPRATYLVVARHPLDTAVSLYPHSLNIDRARVRELVGCETEDDRAPSQPLHEWLLGWIDWDGDARQELDSLPGIMWHLSDAWSRRAVPNVQVVHYDELAADLEGLMRDLAARLGLVVAEARWRELVDAASFKHMRARARELIDPFGVLKDPAAFFRRGRSGAASELLARDEMRRYHRHVAELAPPDLLEWLHRDRPAPAGVGCGAGADHGRDHGAAS